MKKIKNITKAMLLALPLLFMACKSQTAATSNELLITMKKTECYGTCPVYTLKVYLDGKITIHPKSHPVVKKASQGKLDSKTFNKLQNELDQLKVKDLKLKYDDEKLMDAPSTYLTFYNVSPEKEVKARVRIPQSLKNLIKNLETLVKTTKWEPLP